MNTTNDFFYQLNYFYNLNKIEYFLNFKNIKFKKSNLNIFFEFNNLNFIILLNRNNFIQNNSLSNLILNNKVSYISNNIFYWEDSTTEFNFYTLDQIKDLFEFLHFSKNFCFENLTLDNIYFSKKFKRFFFKTIPNHINVEYLLNTNILTFNPKNILEDKSLFEFQNKKISYSEIFTTFFYQGGINHVFNNC